MSRIRHNNDDLTKVIVNTSPQDFLGIPIKSINSSGLTVALETNVFNPLYTGNCYEKYIYAVSCVCITHHYQYTGNNFPIFFEILENLYRANVISR